MYTRPYVPADYHAICALWRANSWPPIPREALPQHGIIAYKNSEIAAAGFLYASDSTIAWLEFIVTNPAVSSEDRHEALTLIIERLLEMARAAGFTHVFSSLRDPGLIARYQAHGFAVSDRGMTNLIKVL